jgi:hypothetical protein
MNTHKVEQGYVSSNEYKGASPKKQLEEPKAEPKGGFSQEAGVYEPSSQTEESRMDVITRLKEEADSKVMQLKSLVEKMLLKQGQSFVDTDEMWKAFANGDFEIDEQTALKAKEEISEDGYWGVEKTAQRIYDFAVALSGGDEATMEKMKEAIKQGFEEATKAWEKELPDISRQTYDAVMKKFEPNIE